MTDAWPYVAAALHGALALLASAHVVLYKRDAKAAIGWVGLVWLSPVFGGLFYLAFGVNRIHRRARSLRRQGPERSLPRVCDCTEAEIAAVVGADHEYYRPLMRLGATATQKPLLAANAFQPLFNGDEAYPAMVAAIDAARCSVILSSYLFAPDRAGRLFQDALARAAGRGVPVRVLIDSVGARYGLRSIVDDLRRAGITAATFLPAIPWKLRYSNLRNHRKILVVDGTVGFTGGINIRENNLLEAAPRDPVQDLHFRVEGPVVQHLQETTTADWAFATGEVLEGDRWFPDLVPAGPALARGIPEGPDEDLGRLRSVLLGALASARRNVRVMTPYFLPDIPFSLAFNGAAMRGVRVDVVIPERSNLVLVQWASTALLWQILEKGCRVWRSPPPFDHTKLMVVDDLWCLFGSANWDARSLRLNFEFNVECYDRELAARLGAHVDARIAQSREITLEDVDGRSIPRRVRDGVARLLSPYL